MHTEAIEYADGDVLLEGYLAYDTAIKGKRPGILVCHAWGGQDDFARSKAEALAELGYVGFAIDMYGKGKRGNSPDENAKLMQPFMDDRELLAQRILAAMETVKTHFMVESELIGAIGFCFGGMCALDLARKCPPGLRAIVSFHGLLSAPKALESDGPSHIDAKILALHGFDDPLAPPEQVIEFAREMTDAGADWQMQLYGHAKHAFTNPLANDDASGIIYNATADQRSWFAMKNFFDEIFG